MLWNVCLPLGLLSIALWFSIDVQGDIDQFGSMLSFNPQSKLGIWLGVNVPGQEAEQLLAAFSDELQTAVAAAVVAAAQSSAKLPRRAREFVGAFKGYVPALLTNMTIRVELVPAADAKQLTATFAWGSGGAMAVLHPGPSDNQVSSAH